MGLLSVIAGILVVVVCAALLIGIGAVVSGFFVAIFREWKSRREARQVSSLERNIVTFLKSLRLLPNEHLRIVKGAILDIYRSDTLYCQVICEVIDRLIAGKQMEDRDVRTIIKMFEAWNEQSRKAVPTSTT
jgi:hypothetical protein